MSKQFNWLNQAHAEDVILYHRFLYYVRDNPILADKDYDTMELEALTQFPKSTILRSVGSSNIQDYPSYIREGRRPNKEERAERDLAYILQ